MRSFIEELRHRNVFRVGVAYLVAGWLVAQVADLGADAFNAPDWFMQMLIIILLAGWPVALFLSWAYELTPGGLVKAAEVPADAPKDPRAGRALNVIIISALSIAVILLAWDRLSQTGETGAATEAAVDRSIAVLPFEDFSPDQDHAWFAKGLSEEILNALARTPDLLIASRTSSFSYLGSSKDIPTIAKELDVAHVLEGSIRRSGDRLRVTAQLIRAEDDKHLWSENFDGSIEDSIEIQESIAFEIAKALQTAMDPLEMERMLSAGTRSVEAWELYLRAIAMDQELRAQGGGAPDLFFDLIALLDRVVEIDPSFGDAHLMLADRLATQINPTSTQYFQGNLTLSERQEQFSRALNAAIQFSRSDMSRLEAELRAAGAEVRIMDMIATATTMTEIAAERQLGWVWLQDLYMQVGEDDKATEAGLTAWALPDEPGVSRGPLIQNMHRTNPAVAVRLVDESLSVANPDPNIMYQSHRALLAAGLVERGAQLAEQYVNSTDDVEGIRLVRIRQACAEGRVADAEQIYAEIEPESSNQWLYLKILGRHEEAREVLRPLDTPQTISILADYLTYRSFEARDYPLLWKTLTSQGINRPQARPMAYQCGRYGV